ncbi:MAG: agmatinase [Oscillospiraceae bacterium]|nr:agmatinase [Oscillospiraceae bacterium]
MNPTYETFIGCDCPYETADVVLFGAPFDSTTSFRPGTRFGSKAMRSDSFGIETYSPYQDLDLEDYNVCDLGDLELPFGNSPRVLSQLHDTAQQILRDGKIPMMLGGEHLASLGPIEAASAQYPDLCVLHFDAHTDLRQDYLGETLSHATVMRRVWDLLGDDRLYQFGIRSGERAEFYWAKEHTFLQKFNFDHLEAVVEKLQGRPVYFSIDLDVLDPSVFPGTGTPEAGGVTFLQLLNAIITAGRLNIVGMDLMELCPVYDQSGVSTAVACKTARELLLSVLSRRK